MVILKKIEEERQSLEYRHSQSNEEMQKQIINLKKVIEVTYRLENVGQRSIIKIDQNEIDQHLKGYVDADTIIQRFNESFSLI